MKELIEQLKKEGKPPLVAKSQAVIIQAHGCCEKARLIHCVCTYSFDCPVHGSTHIGSHD